MKKTLILLTSGLALVTLLLAACGGVATPTTTSAPTRVSSAPTATLPAGPTSPSKSTAQTSPATFETKSDSGGSVTVDVKPTTLEVGQPIAFDIAMNTHSVDLSDDMTKIAVLRDDTGKEYAPLAWEGGGPGGHHREGILKFAPLTNKPKYVELVIKGLAKVPERVFRWDLP